MPERARRDQCPSIAGVISAAEVAATVDAIGEVQLADGNIPWFPGGHTDPWNLIEAAMALDVGGRHHDAARAYAWLAQRQLPDGGWYAYYLGDAIEDPTRDTNVTCYIANGVLHHYLSTGDRAFLSDFWPVVERAIDYALGFQAEAGPIAWRGDDPADGALLTGSSSIHSSLRCAVLLADHLGHERPDWELSLGSLGHAIQHRPTAFLDKSRWAMDWYYPVLGGALRDEAGRERLREGWSTFVVEGRGVRCVSDQPWITAAETCELVLTLDGLREHDEALRLFTDVQFLRAESGGYWTGANFDEADFSAPGELFPVEQPTWNSAAVVLAAHALGGSGLTHGFFRGEGLPAGLSPDLLENAAEIGQRED